MVFQLTAERRDASWCFVGDGKDVASYISTILGIDFMIVLILLFASRLLFRGIGVVYPSLMRAVRAVACAT